MPNILHKEHLLRGIEYWNEWVRQQGILSPSQPTRHTGAKIGVSGFWADLSKAKALTSSYATSKQPQPGEHSARLLFPKKARRAPTKPRNGD